LPDPAIFPAEDLRVAADEVLRNRAELALQYGPEQGYGPLIDYIRHRLTVEEDLDLERDSIMLTGGSAQALDHLCSLFTLPGDIVLVETPTYHETLQLFRDHRLRPQQIPTDDSGLQPEALTRHLEALAQRGERARILYTIPNYQNPSGITLAADRRPDILAIAQRFDLLLVEDDVYRDLAYEGNPPPSLFALDDTNRVLRIGSFSKILAPGVRMGWIMGPTGLIARLISSGLRSMGGGASPLMANILSTYCRHGHLEPHIANLRQVYRERRDTMLQALISEMPEGVDWTRPRGGFFIWLRLPPPLRAAEVARLAREAKLLIPVGDPFFAQEPTGQYLRLAFSYVTPPEIQAGVKILGKVLRQRLR
jgi:2-aminoadipate transaminase